jgi:hypothetical protein
MKLRESTFPYTKEKRLKNPVLDRHYDPAQGQVFKEIISLPLDLYDSPLPIIRDYLVFKKVHSMPVSQFSTGSL